MQTILNDSDYVFDASLKTITLADPYANVSSGQILSILDITTGDMLYDSRSQLYQPITIVGAVVTHSHGVGIQADTDSLQIIVDGVAKSGGCVQDWTAVAQNTVVKSGEVVLSGASATMCIQAALDTTTAHTGTRFIVQVSASNSGDADWQDRVEFVALIGTAATDAIENNPLAASSTSITLTSHSFTSLGEWLFIEDGTLADSEIVFESAQTTNAVTLLDGTENAHAVSTAIFNIVMEQSVALNGDDLRARLVVDNAYDSDGSTLDYKVCVTQATGV